MNSNSRVISDRIVELHFERSEDFGQDIQCIATNSAGSDRKREIIPGCCKFISHNIPYPRTSSAPEQGTL